MNLSGVKVISKKKIFEHLSIEDLLKGKK